MTKDAHERFQIEQYNPKRIRSAFPLSNRWRTEKKGSLHSTINSEKDKTMAFSSALIECNLWAKTEHQKVILSLLQKN